MLKKYAGWIIIAAVCFSLGASALMANKSTVSPSDETVDEGYAVNTAGQTYGSAFFARTHEERPDLISAVGSHGTVGYIYSSDLDAGEPTTPSEAFAQQTRIEELIKEYDGEEIIVFRTIPLYDVDGITVLDEFNISFPSVRGGGDAVRFRQRCGTGRPEKIQAAYDSILRQEEAQTDLCFSFTLPNTAVFTLGPQEGAFPWGLALDAEPVLLFPAMDGFGPCYEVELDDVTLTYTVFPDDGTEVLYRMTTDSPRVSTDSGISVGNTLTQLQEQYPDSVPLDGYSETGPAYIWEPGGPAYCRHIAFFVQNDVVTGIEIENLMDIRLLE